jgi:hypothetical protein
MVERQVTWLGAKAEELLQEFDRAKPTSRLRSFKDVDVLWRDVVEPALPSFLSLQLDAKNTGQAVPENSRWRLNWRAELPPTRNL